MSSYLEPAYHVVTIPDMRQAQIDVLGNLKRARTMHALIEVDVSIPRTRIRVHKARTGETISFTGYIAACLGCAVGEHKMMQAYRRSGDKLIVFDDVDISTQMERQIGSSKIVVPHIIRAANRKTVMEIHREIREAQSMPSKVPNQFKHVRWYLRLPAFLRNLAWQFLRRNPKLTKQLGGTIGLTAVGMFGNGAGWGIPVNPVPLLVTLGGIVPRACLTDDGRVEMREHLCMTLSIDHDIVDGAPAARFTQCFRELVESGYGLYELDAVIPRRKGEIGDA